jgi:hypothetical protein
MAPIDPHMLIAVHINGQKATPLTSSCKAVKPAKCRLYVGVKITNTRNERYKYPKTKDTDTAEGLMSLRKFTDQCEEWQVHGNHD